MDGKIVGKYIAARSICADSFIAGELQTAWNGITDYIQLKNGELQVFNTSDAYKEEVGLHAFGNDSSPFSGRIICSHCGKPYRRCGWSRNGKKFWMCASKKAKDASSCQADNIFEESIFEAFRVAWNGVIANKEKSTEKWNEQIESGTPLERLRAKQMKMMVKDGTIQTVIPEHVILVLERIIAYDKIHFEVRFLDGTIKRIGISE